MLKLLNKYIYLLQYQDSLQYFAIHSGTIHRMTIVQVDSEDAEILECILFPFDR